MLEEDKSQTTMVFRKELLHTIYSQLVAEMSDENSTDAFMLLFSQHENINAV